MLNIGPNTLFQSFPMYFSNATNVLNKTVTRRGGRMNIYVYCNYCSRKLVHGPFPLYARRYDCYNAGNALLIIIVIIVETRKLLTNRSHL